ncbi:APC amino acid permease [Dentipellis sp. KUC8613]|nr:APC amino acid permease [Dentipellis sp. KUC8613]
MPVCDVADSISSENEGIPRAVDAAPPGDDALLESLGYKQELKRTFTPLELFGVGFSIIGLFPSISAVLVYSLSNGGPVAMIWGWAVCVFGLMAIALCIAELGSAAPTSGGLYYWTYVYSSPRYRNILSWIVGYSNTIGNIASVASVEWGFSQQLMAAISIGSDLTFAATTAQTFGVYTAVLFVHAVACSVAVKYIARLQKLYTALNALLCIVIIIALPAATPAEFRNTKGYVFGHFENPSGWPDGFAFVLSFLAPLWAIGAFDASVHISEEATNARIAVPYATLSATATASVLGWGILIAVAFNMGTDLQAILSSPIQQPMAAILFNSFGKHGTLAVWVFVVIAQFIMGLDMLLVCSRQIFAFSRDGALPLSSLLRSVHPRTHTPICAVWGAALLALALALLAFAGAGAISAVFALVVAGQYVAYAIPISARLVRRHTSQLPRGPFALGRFSLPAAVAALLFMAFVLVVFMFPASPAPTSAGMNYTVVVWGGTIVLSLVYYAFPRYGGRHWFKGPVSTLRERDGAESGESGERGGEEEEKIGRGY